MFSFLEYYTYRNVEMARRSQSPSQAAWYNNALGYWNECEPTVEGMLGGFGVLTERDVKGSNKFIKNLSKIREFKYDTVVRLRLLFIYH